ncbi:MAG: bacteriohemerythrin [Acidiferrobacterales bacterium]
MALLHWSPNLSVGIDFMDDDHKQLIVLINEFHDAVGTGSTKELITEKFDKLIDFAQRHFLREEKAMEENNYHWFEHHKRVHEALIEEIVELRQDFVAGDLDIGLETTNFLESWLISHILESDKHLGGFLEGRSSL